MEVLKTGTWENTTFKLYEGTLQARGLFNILQVENDEIVDASHWFDSEIKDTFLQLSNDMFVEKCIELLKN